jgi:hypothetical protein
VAAPGYRWQDNFDQRETGNREVCFGH